MRLQSKKEFETLMVQILEPLLTKYFESGARLTLGSTAGSHSIESSQMEAFARPLWGLVPFWCGGGEHEKFEEIYQKGIVAGTDPTHQDYWGDCSDCDQRYVEMASLAYGLLFTPGKVWEPLTESQKENLANWLYQINDFRLPESNWLFFRVLVNVALKKSGRKFSEEKLQADLDKIEEFYLGDGWYQDGANSHNGQKDYYVAFAFHFYSLIYATVMEKEDPERAKAFKDRASQFAKDFIYWFADSGEAVPYGRSLTYRCAQIAFWSICLVADVLPYSVGVIKGLIARNLSYWFSDDRIFDNGHILSIGYRYNQLTMSEGYNAPGSPYWCMKAFAFLALPEEHEFWHCEPLPMPELEPFKVQEKAEVMVGRYDGDATLYPVGTLSIFPNEMMHKYLKFAYSTRFGFSMPRSNWHYDAAAPDSTLAFELDDRIYTRIRNRGFQIQKDRLIIEWSPGFDIEVKTEIIPTKRGHIRKHQVSSPIECIAYDSGFAMDYTDRAQCETEQNQRTAFVKNHQSYCSASSESGIPETRRTAPNTNLLSPQAIVPLIKYEIKIGMNEFETEICEMG